MIADNEDDGLCIRL